MIATAPCVDSHAVGSVADLPLKRASPRTALPFKYRLHKLEHDGRRSQLHDMFQHDEKPRLFGPFGIRSRAGPHDSEKLQELVTAPWIAEQEDSCQPEQLDLEVLGTNGARRALQLHGLGRLLQSPVQF